MPKKGTRKVREPIGDITDPMGFEQMADVFLTSLETTNYSPYTIRQRRSGLDHFTRWAADRGITQVVEVTKPIIDRYQRYLYRYRKKGDNQPLSFLSQRAHLMAVKAFFKYLARNNYILSNPASELELPRIEKRLPRHVLTVNEAERVLVQPKLSDPLGVRDRAILEILYSTGIRRLELINLKLYDMDVERGTVMIRQGKGKKDRMIPIGDRAMMWVDKYLTEVRPRLVFEPDDGTLFLANHGEQFTPCRLTQMVGRYVRKADINKSGACHLFRHTMATLMLENGADIRFIQQMLGHSRLETTEIYTKVSIRKLKEIHTATHPAKLKKSGR